MASVAYVQQRSKWTHEEFTSETSDHEDHTFCGVMFDLTCKNAADLPVDSFQVDSLAVRGGLGMLRVFWTKDTFRGKHAKPREWTLIYERHHRPSWNELVPLVLPEPLVVPVGASVGLYVHSSESNDESIVYDNQRGHNGHSDAFITILPGYDIMYLNGSFLGFPAHSSLPAPQDGALGLHTVRKQRAVGGGRLAGPEAIRGTRRVLCAVQAVVPQNLPKFSCRIPPQCGGVC